MTIDTIYKDIYKKGWSYTPCERLYMCIVLSSLVHIMCFYIFTATCNVLKNNCYKKKKSHFDLSDV
jgi:hypothetical protein